MLARPRDFVKRNAAVHSAARGLLKPAFLFRRAIEEVRLIPYRLALALRRLARLARFCFRPVSRLIWPPPFSAKAVAFAEARATGGAISLQELEDLWETAARCRRVLCIAEGPELAQLRIVLRARRVKLDALPPQTAGRSDHRLPARKFDLIVAVGEGKAADSVRHLQRNVDRGPGILVLGRAGPVGEKNRISSRPASASASGLSNEVARLGRLKVLLLNDVGFLYGAGTALKRQAASFLLNGWDVAVMAWNKEYDVGPPELTGINDLSGWHGGQSLEYSNEDKSRSGEELVEVIRPRLPFHPDVIVLGNIHGGGWPVDIPARLRVLGSLVIAYMHDCYWVSGRCAYPGSCTLFHTGCDARCPTPDEYPRLAPEKIAPAWQERSGNFSGQAAVPLITNSHWTLAIARQRYGTAARTEMIHLGIDHHLFAPLPKPVVRRLLGLPSDKTIIAMGAVDVRDRWKGGEIFEAVCKVLQGRDDVALILFGRASERFSSARSFGIIWSERLMPFVFNAADLYVTTAIEEAFGQTLLEASACGVPAVAFNVGGIKDIVVHEETGLLVDRISASDLLAAIERLVGDAALREKLGRNGRARVESRFTLAHQAAAWDNCLARLCETQVPA
jgi:glycosyltransferase involved in cell wall biosynthesis